MSWSRSVVEVELEATSVYWKSKLNRTLVYRISKGQTHLEVTSRLFQEDLPLFTPPPWTEDDPVKQGGFLKFVLADIFESVEIFEPCVWKKILDDIQLCITLNWGHRNYGISHLSSIICSKKSNCIYDVTTRIQLTYIIYTIIFCRRVNIVSAFTIGVFTYDIYCLPINRY